MEPLNPKLYLLVGFLLGCVVTVAKTQCQWSNWHTTEDCPDQIQCTGNRTDTRQRNCSVVEEEIKTVDCNGLCKPCSAWSEWSRPCWGLKCGVVEFRARHCYFYQKVRLNDFETRSATCPWCPPCGPGEFQKLSVE